MSNEHMGLWRQVEKTDPAATKNANVGGQKITSVGGQHMIKRATEIFGPVGIGWGWSVLEERFDQGGAVYRESSGDHGKGFELIGHEVGHTIKIRLWYKLSGERGEVEQYGCTPFAYKSKWGITTDLEAPKKSLTDAIKKSLVMLGFSADIFLGMFDDPDYVKQRQEEEVIDQAADKDAEIERQRLARLKWLETAVVEISAAPTMHALKMLHAKFVRDASRRKEDKFVTRLARAFDERATEISKAEVQA